MDKIDKLCNKYKSIGDGIAYIEPAEGAMPCKYHIYPEKTETAGADK